jgi:16S rRNA (cytosine1402-N4)-methyltransferase
MQHKQYDYHEPVLLEETIEGLITDLSGTYIDGTMGGGGHTRHLLQKLNPDAKVIGVDQDEEAILKARDGWGKSEERLEIIHGNFGYTDRLLKPELHGHIDGIMLDLGVSSHQIDEPERGFSYQYDGPLDMRMGTLSGTSAHSVVNDYSEKALTRIFFTYGEERHSRKIAQAILKSRPLETTGDLKSVIESVIFGRHVNKSVARIFQAIRIEVNRELEMLERILHTSLDLLSSHGRLSIISYHSLEDRLVKNFFKSGNLDGKIEKDFYGKPLTPFNVITRKPIMAEDDEIAKNPRARSARLRFAEKKSEEEE